MRKNSSNNTEQVINLFCVQNYKFILLVLSDAPSSQMDSLNWRGNAADGADQVANTAAQGSAPSFAWQPFNVVKVQLRDKEKGGKDPETILKRAENQQRPGEWHCTGVGALHSPRRSDSNIYILGAEVPTVQVVWRVLLRALISPGSNVSSSELLRATVSIIKICVSFLKMFFL